jgi:TRAP-type C4-dicarboxylate transport system permease small subunit
MDKIRKLLDGLYVGAGVMAALFLIAILTLIVLQMLARWTGEVFPGATEYVGYCMATASFFAFASALQRGAHIRVSMLLNILSDGGKRIVEIWCLGIGAVLGWYFVYHATKFVYWSWKFKAISQGQDATPLWIPQVGMIVGAVVFAIALTDGLLHMLLAGRYRIVRDTVDGHTE